MEKIIRGQSFMANGFDVKVILKKDFVNGHKEVKVDVSSEQLKTGLKTFYSEPIYNPNYEEQDKTFYKILDWAKRYFSAPIQAFVK